MMNPDTISAGALQPPQPLTSDILARLRVLHSIIGDASQHTSSVRMRLFGNYPVTPTAGSVSKPDHERSLSDEIFFVIDQIRNTATELLEDAATLNGKV